MVERTLTVIPYKVLLLICTLLVCTEFIRVFWNERGVGYCQQGTFLGIKIASDGRHEFAAQFGGRIYVVDGLSISDEDPLSATNEDGNVHSLVDEYRCCSTAGCGLGCLADWERDDSSRRMLELLERRKKHCCLLGGGRDHVVKLEHAPDVLRNATSFPTLERIQAGDAIFESDGSGTPPLWNTFGAEVMRLMCYRESPFRIRVFAAAYRPDDANIAFQWGERAAGLSE